MAPFSPAFCRTLRPGSSADAEAAGDAQGLAMVEVAPDAGLPRLQARDANLGPAASVRAALATRDDLLRLPLPRLDPPQALGQRRSLADRERERGGGTTPLRAGGRFPGRARPTAS
jgi:hypothetical protein